MKDGEQARSEGMGEVFAPLGAVGSGPAPDASAVRAFRASLAGDLLDTDDTARIETIRALEELKAAAAAAQARLSAAFDRSQRAAQSAAGVPRRRVGRGISAQIALARRDSPAKGGRYLGLAKALTSTLPHTLQGLEYGLISEWRAMLILREIACLSDTDQREIDRLLAADTSALEGWGDRRVAAEAHRHALRLDNAALAARARRAPQERRVTIRPAPDSMTYLTALLPVAQGVAAYAALSKYADQRRADAEPRSRGQVMADTLVECVTGRSPVDPVPIDVRMVITDRTLFAGDDEPAYLPGYGHIPGAQARDLVTGAIRHSAKGRAYAWLRAVYTHPAAGALIAMSSRRRTAPPGLADLIDTRDQTCRTPWCDAPIRHHDHITPAVDGGPTCFDGMQGLCEGCNYTKQAPGWTTRGVAGSRHTVQTTTPTGRVYRSRAPAPPGAPSAADLVDYSYIEGILIELAHAA